jgi:hypothetical protein
LDEPGLWVRPEHRSDYSKQFFFLKKDYSKHPIYQANNSESVLLVFSSVTTREERPSDMLQPAPHPKAEVPTGVRSSFCDVDVIFLSTLLNIIDTPIKQYIIAKK